jgi:hypothetical protein
MSRYPLTQNCDYHFQQIIGQQQFGQAKDELTRHAFGPDYPLYVPGQDALVVCVDTTGASSGEIQNVWQIDGVFPSKPRWLTRKPDDIPLPDHPGGNDKYTCLLMRGNEGPAGARSFKDCSWKNYRIRFYGQAKLSGDGWYLFDGNGSCIAPELYGPGFGLDTEREHNDWCFGTSDFAWDIVANPTAVSTALQSLLAFDGGYGPFLLGQASGNYVLYATTAYGAWNIAGNATIGPVVASDTLLSVERYQGALHCYINGQKLLSAPIPGNAPLYYPMDGSGTLPKGRPVLGAQADINNSANVVGVAWYSGKMKNIRFSKTARYQGATFTPPIGPYTP